MGNSQRFSCFLIGSDSLLIECGDILLERGHEVRGVISATARIADWAREGGLRWIEPAGDFGAELGDEAFEFLFSITYLSLIPGSVLARPSRLAVNFHDGPLPAYAGLNTPAWGLMNRERKWGITWHVITTGVDKGDILKQRLFEIVPGETALTLNTRCFETAIDSFGELVDELAAGTQRRTVQDFSKRTYFGKHTLPPAACALDWGRSAAELEAQVRALDFGRYANLLGVAKVQVRGEAFIVHEAAEAQGTGAGEPGTVVGIDDGEIRVATGKGVLALRAFATTGGQGVSPTELASRTAVRVGSALGRLSAEEAERLTTLNGLVRRAEEFWVGRLAGLEPIELQLPGGGEPDADPAAAPVTIPVPADLHARSGAAERADVVIAAIGAYLARIGDVSSFHVGFRDGSLRRLIAGFEPWFAGHVPLLIDVDAAKIFDAARASLAAELETVRRGGTYLRDVVARHPELRAHSGLVGGRAFSVIIERGDGGGVEPGSDGEIVAFAVADDGSSVRCRFDPARVSRDGAAALERQLAAFLESLAVAPARALGEHSLLTAEERRRILVDWNKTDRPFRELCVHQLFEEQAARTPDAVAAAFGDESLTYRQLNERSNQLATHLRTLGVGPDRLVGIYIERSLDLLVAILGTLKAGGAYVPLDPAYPTDRIALMLEDSQAAVIITQDWLAGQLPAHPGRLVRMGRDWPAIAAMPTGNLAAVGGTTPANLAYVIYTSGSTGKPKGVMVEHRNVANFCTGMDEQLAHDPPGVWLAVTSLSFDISVLELMWTLARGFKVVIAPDQHIRHPGATRRVEGRAGQLNFSLFYFASDEGELGEGGAADKYRLLIEGAKFADRNGFGAVWTPERHFHAFGGLYPNPSVAAAALATITKNVQLRAGSVVLPLHHPIRIAEEWSLVDNLSSGRVGISFASGWQPVDFVLRPENYQDRNALLYSGIETVRKLWRGEAVEFRGVTGEMTQIRTLPRPIQSELPVWVTTAGSLETWKSAARAGANILTHLLGQTVDEVAEKVRVYRDEWHTAGHSGAGVVSIMLHTFVGEDRERVKEIVRRPMIEYLRSSLSLVKNVASSWAAFKRKADGTIAQSGIDLKTLSDDEMNDLLAFSFERYFETSGLFGTPDECVRTAEALEAAGVDDIACLIDYGVPSDTVLEHLELLSRVRERVSGAARRVDLQSWSLGRLIREHGVTHLQCTPSMAGMLLVDQESREALRSVRNLMIGGEALPVSLAAELRAVTEGRAQITNMYGPTETTIWSSTHPADGAGESSTVPIGRPIANTRLYVLDSRLNPVPVGVAGELYIGGAGVVRGYLNRPELTGERFVRDPFHEGAARMYRTGDVARFMPDGVVEFLGRGDHQVKIRGHRIELGEIEAAIMQFPGGKVREAVVIAREDTPGDKRLVGYVVPHKHGEVSVKGLRESLRARLPDHMVPSHLVVMDALPLTPNKKVDRKALPAPTEPGAAARAPGGSGATAPVGAARGPSKPASEIERIIVRVWLEVLGLEEAGTDDNFFDLGGHSLLAVKAHRKLKEAFQRDIAITDLFRFPTVRSLAAFLGDTGGDGTLQKSQERAASRRELLVQRQRARTRPGQTGDENGA